MSCFEKPTGGRGSGVLLSSERKGRGPTAPARGPGYGGGAGDRRRHGQTLRGLQEWREVGRVPALDQRGPVPYVSLSETPVRSKFGGFTQISEGNERRHIWR